EHEYRLRRNDGHYRWFYSLTRVDYDNGKPATMLRYCLDIAVRKAAEEEVHSAHRFVDSIVENIPAMVIVKSARDLKFVRVNRATEQLLGHSRDYLLGKTDHDLF